LNEAPDLDAITSRSAAKVKVRVKKRNKSLVVCSLTTLHDRCNCMLLVFLFILLVPVLAKIHGKFPSMHEKCSYTADYSFKMGGIYCTISIANYQMILCSIFGMLLSIWTAGYKKISTSVNNSMSIYNTVSLVYLNRIQHSFK
jgi:hypothetical protein